MQKNLEFVPRLRSDVAHFEARALIFLSIRHAPTNLIYAFN